jgi:ATP-dependent DNA helicase RecG
MLDYTQNLLDSSVATLKGVGAKKAEKLAKLGISTVGELLEHFPWRYEDRREVSKISDLKPGIETTFFGRVIRTGGRPYKVVVADGSGAIELIFFNSQYIPAMLKKDKDYVFYGKPQIFNTSLQIIHPEFVSKEKFEASIIPIYRLTKGLKQAELRRIIASALEMLGEEIADFIPDKFVNARNMVNYTRALREIHFSKSYEAINIAKYRLIYNDFFMLNLGLKYIASQKDNGANGIKFTKKYKLENFSSFMPFKLTAAQKRAINEIYKDMETASVMYRLVAGDVGSGKTAVAMAAIQKAVNDGYQAAFMAPTEILAAQHFREIKKLFPVLKAALLTGSLKASERASVLDGLKNGDIELVIGTHALISKTVLYKNLGLAITDEQHRFGVSQRKQLSAKGLMPDILVMSATPIPRSLAWINYGDMDLSFLDEMPLGRKPIETHYFLNQDRRRAYEALWEELKLGHQAYIVCPIIEESEALEGVLSIDDIFAYAKKVFPNESIACLHGDIKQNEKDSVMTKFLNKEISILCATTVIEVGIDVKNATIMIIENAERFGLAQLHQLRGRVGRSSFQSYCYLLLGSIKGNAEARAKALVKHQDGLSIADKDLELRGSGDLLGERQHGVINLKIGDPYKKSHEKILIQAKEDVDTLLASREWQEEMARSNAETEKKDGGDGFVDCETQIKQLFGMLIKRLGRGDVGI